MDLNQNINLSPTDSKQADSIWSTSIDYPINRTEFYEESKENGNRYTQQSQDNIFNVLSPKRQHSVSSVCELSKATPVLPKRVKTLSSPQTQKASTHPVHRAKVGSITLSWPQYKIPETIYMNKKYTVTNTCSLDAALFAFYYCYKTSSSEFQKLFDVETTSCHSALRKLFKLVDNDGWNIARLYWLLSNNLLKTINDDGVFDVEHTLYENVLQFVRPMQMYNIKSKCSCSVCPKRIRESKSIDISLL